jgi:hypothetical protein
MDMLLPVRAIGRNTEGVNCCFLGLWVRGDNSTKRKLPHQNATYVARRRFLRGNLGSGNGGEGREGCMWRRTAKELIN